MGTIEETCGVGKDCEEESVQGVCPVGWHLPSLSEWETLVNNVGGFAVAAENLKSTSGWYPGGTSLAATRETREKDAEYSGTDAYGFTALATGIGIQGQNPIDGRFAGAFEFSGLQSKAFFWTSTQNDTAKAWSVMLNQTDLKRHDTTTVKANALSVRCVKDDNNAIVPLSSSSVKSSSSSAVLRDTRDYQNYEYVTIGTQTWMAANLNYELEYSDIRSRCANLDCDYYGRLYNWTDVVDACPWGWRLPNEDDWETLFTYVGGAENAGKFLKSTRLWATNAGEDTYGFNILPAGIYHLTYVDTNVAAYFWSESFVGGDSAHVKVFRENSDAVVDSVIPQGVYTSVRCLKGELEETPKEFEYGTFIDERDSQTYKTIQVDTLIWMAENLKYESEESWHYEDEYQSDVDYGRLYSSNTAFACPDGWRLPSIEEWTSLADNNDLKTDYGWFAHGNGKNSIGFSALPAGRYHINASDKTKGSFQNVEKNASFWVYSYDDSYLSIYELNYYENTSSRFDPEYGTYACAVRCVRPVEDE